MTSKASLWEPGFSGHGFSGHGSSETKIDVLGLGENSVDYLYEVEDWPKPGGKLDLSGAEPRAGGQIASAVLGCRRLGLRTAYLGCAGDDPEARDALENLAEEGVDLSAVRKIPGARTRTALILVRRADGERLILERRDPQLRLATEELNPSLVRGAGLLLVDTTDPDASTWAARIARAEGIPVVLDADRVCPEIEDLLRYVDFPVVSENFARQWGGGESARQGVERLSASGARLAIATCGVRGAWVSSSTESWHSPAFDVEVRDTTGAGDAFHAGLIWALLAGKSLEEVVGVAQAAAGLSCGALGAQDGLPTIAVLRDFLERNPPPGIRASPSERPTIPPNRYWASVRQK
jgi:sugar/nucleoside kinase (ribokinase family)